MTNKRLNLVLVVSAIIGAILFVLLDWSDVAPTRGGTITEEQAILHAESFWERQNVPVKSFKASAIQDTNAEAEGYLTKNQLQQAYDKIAPKQAPLEFWTVTFSDAKSGYSYSATVDLQSGDVVGFKQSGYLHTLPTVTPHVSQLEQALFAVGLNPEHLSAPKKAATQTSGSTTYQLSDKQWNIGQMGLRYDVSMQQGRVESISAEYLVPQSFTDWRQKQLLIGSLLTLLSLLGTIVMFVFAFAYLFILKRPKRKTAAILLTIAIFIFSLISNINQLPALGKQSLGQAMGSAAQTFSLVVAVLLMTVTALFTALSTYPAIATGGVLLEEMKPRLWTKWRSPEWGSNLRQAVWRGYLLAVAWLGFQQLFYYVAQNVFGVWSENDPSLSPNNFMFPALFPIMAWMAGFQEELFYRMFGVTFCKRYLKSTWLAVLLPAMVWALGHSLYPVYPTYTRFIELSIFGSIIGLCYLKFGIETVIVAHLVFDSVQMCLALLATGEQTMIVAGTILLVLPMIGGFGLSLVSPRRKKQDYQPEMR